MEKEIKGRRSRIRRWRGKGDKENTKSNAKTGEREKKACDAGEYKEETRAKDYNRDSRGISSTTKKRIVRDREKRYENLEFGKKGVRGEG